jgi:hypothetical protein
MESQRRNLMLTRFSCTLTQTRLRHIVAARHLQALRQPVIARHASIQGSSSATLNSGSFCDNTLKFSEERQEGFD